jgi:VCBS repeat-containing protein
MANDATTQIPQGSHEADMAASAHDGDYAAVQVAEATPQQQPATPDAAVREGHTVHVQIPQGGTVVRVPVEAGDTVVLPPPFDEHHDLAAKEGNGNLAIKVGDVTVILQGYIDAANDPQHPVTLDGSDGQPIDIATVLASTDPNLDIQTAAGPAAGAQGADNTGAILAALAGGPGLGGLNAVGVLDQTELAYKLIDNSIRQEQETLLNSPLGPLTITTTPPTTPLHQSFLHDPIVTLAQMGGHLDFASFTNGWPAGGGQQGHAGFDNSWADFDGTEAKAGAESVHAVRQIVIDPHADTVVNVALTATGLEAQHLTSDGIELHYEISADGSTVFGFRGDGQTSGDGALVLVVHVGQPTDGGGTVQNFPVDYYLVNRLDDTSGDGTQTDLNVSFNVTTGDDRSAQGTIDEMVLDDNPAAVADFADVKNNDGYDSGKASVEDNDNFGADGKLGSVLNVEGTGGVVGVEAGDTKTTHVGGQATDVHGQFGTLHLNADGTFTYARDDTGPTKGDQNDVFTYTIEDDDGDLTSTTLNIHINDHGVIIVPPPPPGDDPKDNPIDLNAKGTAVFESALAIGSDPASTLETTKGHVDITAPDGIGSATIKDHNGNDVVVAVGAKVVGDHGTLTVTTWDPTTGKLDYSYTLDTPEQVPGAGNNVDNKGEDFQITATDKDGDKSTGDIVIAIVDDVPTAKADADVVNQAAGEHTTGNVVTGIGDKDSSLVADVNGADGPVAVVGVAAGDTGKASDTGAGADIQGTYGTLHLNGDGTYTYTVGAGGMVQGKDDVFTYTIQDKDGDTSTTTLTISSSKTPDIKHETPGAHPGEVDVYEAGLPAGSKDGPTDTTATGTFLIDSHGEGFQSLNVGGKDIPLNGAGLPLVVKSDATGTLEITGVTDKGNGAFEITYEYDLKGTVTDNTAGQDGHNPVTLPTFDITATDTSGDVAHNQITVKVVDDVPFAKADADDVNYAANSTTTGNVITAVGDADSHLVKDIQGADQPGSITGIDGAGGAGKADGKGGFDVTGAYGTLHINGDGTYTYTVGAAGMVQGKDDVFTYTLTDKDGDSSSTTLTIETSTIPDIKQETPANHPGEVDVYEAGLSDGSKDGPTATSATGTFMIDSHGEGFSSLSVGGKDVPLDGNGLPVIISSDATGTLEVTGVADKGNGKFEITYEYDLKDNILDNTAGQDGHNAVVLPDVPIVATDKSGDQASSSISVHVVDDVPFAKVDTDTVNVAVASKTAGNVISGVGDADSHLQADVSGADGPAHITGISNTKSGSVAEVGGKFTIAGDHGTLVIDENGNYTYTVGGTPLKQGDTDKFTYTITDADGDSSTTTLTIDVNCPSITQGQPGAHPGEVDVYEAGLPGGSKDGPTDIQASGTFAIDSHGEGFSSVTVGGQAVSLDNFKAVNIADSTGTMTITGVTNDGQGHYTLSYQYTLKDNIIDNTAGQDGHNAVTLPTYSIVATDKSGDVATSALTVKVVDDIPISHDSTKAITATGGNFNILLTIDLSNSMNDSSGVAKADGTGTYTKLELEKAAIADLLATYQAQGDVAVHVTWFNDPQSGGPNGAGDASNDGYGSNDGGWMTVSQAIAYVNGLIAQGNTNYDVAINEAEKSYDDKTGYIAGGTNVAYFFSDGQPNQNSGPGSDNANGVGGQQQKDWESFLTTNDVNAYAIGVGTDAVAGALTPIAYNGANGTDPAGNTIVVTNLGQLSSVISQTVPAGTAGNLIGDVGGTYGADGPGHVNSFSVDGGAAHVYDSKAADHTVSVDLAEGTFTLNMDTGEYTYTPKAGTEQTDVNVTFNIMDADGDISNTSTLHLVPTNHAPQISTNGAGDTAAIDVVEGAKIVTTVHAVDTDINSSVTYSITGGADKSLFTIDSKTGVLSFVNGHTTGAPQDAGGNNVYDVTVTATDNKGGTDSQAIAVSVEAAAVAVADHVYTNSGGSVTILDQFLLANDTDKDTPHDQLKVSDTTASAGQNDFFDSLPTHGDDTHGSGWTSINLDTSKDFNGDGYLTSGKSTGFDYTVNDGAGDSAAGHVTVTYVSGTTIDGSSDGNGAILIGTSQNETFKGGSGDDIIVTRGGSDTVNGGAGFDQVVLSGDAKWSSSFSNVEMANLHDGQKGSLTINAADVLQNVAGTIGGKDVDLFVTGDHDGKTTDTVNLNGFHALGGSPVAFTDPGTNTSHTYDLYQGTGTHTGVIVAVEHELDVTAKA